MVELQKIKGQNHFFSTAANQTLHTGMIIQKIHHTNMNEHVRLRTQRRKRNRFARTALIWERFKTIQLKRTIENSP